MRWLDLDVWRFALVAAAAFGFMEPTPAAAQQPPQRAHCSAVEYRQFDFKLGSFDVTTGDGKPAGKAMVESILSGCLLVEHWHGASGRRGRIHYYLEHPEKLWHMVIVLDDGETMNLTGTLTGDAMVFTGVGRFEKFQGLHRMTWSPLPNGGVRQFWELSSDNGATWKTDFVGLYHRRP